MQLLWKKFKKQYIEANIDECGIEVGTPHTGYEYQVTKHAVLHVVMSGSGTFSYNGQTHFLETGDIFLLQRGMNVNYTASLDDPWIYYWVGFSGQLVNDYLNRTQLIDNPVITHTDTSTISKLVERMCYTAQSYTIEQSDDIQHMSDLYNLLYALYQVSPKKFDQQEAGIYENVREAIRYMNRFYMQAITIEQVARHVNISRSYLYKLFKQNLDQSPQSYLMQLRMSQAAKLLHETSLQSKEIAARVGYHEPLMFSKAFKKFFGVTPTMYRKNKGIHNTP
ncbi:AraC family transcriptional regulator [Staphylococcus muscae]|uniref:AraC family transcriptional regulator n=1 Tax=Staphylococcus muscae TaxID=1294 RepID=A0A240C7N6_9STAP|nr:AraC family transcriptional regulator [Staphylococcus muscae]AVQ33728.1 AraC family transcriptional regulator [Staphylococcus muscae]PNZ03609.1 AraC family transcriptional regulator [Staphylococcus muscae]GGA87266.1 AraC family transcriptional regulator [Staphylococcus muscae]SNW04101.1 AraC family transcriptional regulator [Staphylococcus muscae]